MRHAASHDRGNFLATHCVCHTRFRVISPCILIHLQALGAYGDIMVLADHVAQRANMEIRCWDCGSITISGEHLTKSGIDSIMTL